MDDHLSERRELVTERLAQIPAEEKKAWLAPFFEDWAAFLVSPSQPPAALPDAREGKAEELLAALAGDMAVLADLPEEGRSFPQLIYEELFAELYGWAQMPGVPRTARSREMVSSAGWFYGDYAADLLDWERDLPEEAKKTARRLYPVGRMRGEEDVPEADRARFRVLDRLTSASRTAQRFREALEASGE